MRTPSVHVATVFLAFCFAPLLSACGGPAPEVVHPPVSASADLRPPGRYEVQVSTTDPTELEVRLYLAALPAPTTARLPDVPGHEARLGAVGEVHCDDDAVARSPEGFMLPAGCEVLRYSVRSAIIGREGYDPTTLTVVRNPETSAWFAPGAGLFLVPETMQERPRLDVRLPDGVALYHGLESDGPSSLVLPPPTSLGRVFLGFGAWNVRSHADGSMQIQYLADGEVDLATVHPAPPLASAYLARLTGDRRPRKLLVFMFPQAREGGTLSSAAGDRAIAVGYYPEALPEDAPAIAAAAPQVAYLEAWFRLLAGHQLPTWASVSLGRYYALRALVHAGTLSEVDFNAYLEAAVPPADHRTALLAAQGAFAAGDGGARGAFGKEGLGFWAAIAASMAEHAEHDDNGNVAAEGLDDAVPELLGLFYQRDGTPPRRFLTVLTEAGAPDAEALCTAWVGWPAGE